MNINRQEEEKTKVVTGGLNREMTKSLHNYPACKE